MKKHNKLEPIAVQEKLEIIGQLVSAAQKDVVPLQWNQNPPRACIRSHAQ